MIHKMKPPLRSEIVVDLKRQKEWKTNFDEEVVGVQINGRKINDVHDLTEKVISMTKTIRVLAISALTLCIMCAIMAIFFTHWLLSHNSDIQTLLLTTKKEYSQKIEDAKKWNSHRRERGFLHLQEFHGLHWNNEMQEWVTKAK